MVLDKERGRVEGVVGDRFKISNISGFSEHICMYKAISDHVGHMVLFGVTNRCPGSC